MAGEAKAGSKTLSPWIIVALLVFAIFWSKGWFPFNDGDRRSGGKVYRGDAVPTWVQDLQAGRPRGQGGRRIIGWEKVPDVDPYCLRHEEPVYRNGQLAGCRGAKR